MATWFELEVADTNVYYVINSLVHVTVRFFLRPYAIISPGCSASGTVHKFNYCHGKANFEEHYQHKELSLVMLDK